MKPFVSIFNDVLGPVMRGPSSSHTAGAHGIGLLATRLLGDTPVKATCTFDPDGSMATTYKPLAVDRALAAGLMDWSLTDDRFHESLDHIKKSGVSLQFRIAPLEKADHPNAMRIEMEDCHGRGISLFAKSTGGGGFLITEYNHLPINVDGKTHVILMEADKGLESDLRNRFPHLSGSDILQKNENRILIEHHMQEPPESQLLKELQSLPGIHILRHLPPLFYVQKARAQFSSTREILAAAGKNSRSLGQLGLEYEAGILGMSEADVLNEMIRRFQIMKTSVEQGILDAQVNMMLLHPTAGKILEAEQHGKLPFGGRHTRAAARAMAVMHVSNSMGVVCAAPTGGSSGVIPGVVVTLAEEFKLKDKEIAYMLLAASAVGLIIAHRATFAAEVAGCQVEIGAAGAMAAAAVIEYAGGTAVQAADAAAIALQNTMGSICDPVQGTCEIPCHTRNGVAASNAFVCADLILGGYKNPIPLDETIDASFSVGKMLPKELRCTALGGLAITPSAQKLPKKR